MFRNLKLQTRFTFFILVVALPLLIGAVIIISSRANILIEGQANRFLKDANNIIAEDANTWLEQQYRALQQTAKLSEVVSMDPVRQKNALIAMAQSHPNLYLIHTLDLSGFNVARSDDADLKDYSDREYYINVMSGEPIAYQVVIGKTSGQPALVLAVPILDENSNVIGVASSAGLLDNISQDVTDTVLGETGVIFVIDSSNQIIAHTDPAYTTGELRDFSEYPPVAALRQGQEGLITFSDDDGVSWQAFVSQIDNGWGVVAQQTESELLAPVRSFSAISISIVALGAVFLAIFSSVIVRYLLKPLQTVTETATRISEGELNRNFEIDSQDEIGTLATAINKMTKKMRELISTLEQRVADRTRNLELASKVGRAVSQVRELDIMLKDACGLILKEFDLYYVQVYLIDPNKRNLTLEAGTGEVGAQLRERGHSLQLNTNSINGRAAVEKHSVVISNTAESEVFHPNSLLPETRGEMAVPLIVGDKVVGVLDMQSSHPDMLTEEVLPAFEALAGQLAVAIQNANLVAEAEQARAEVEAQARRLVRTGWGEFMDAIHKPEQVGFVFAQNDVTPLADAEDDDQFAEEHQSITAPISLTGEMLGSLVVELGDNNQNEQTSELVNIVARQVAQHIENLRLLESAERFRFEAEQAARRQTREGWQEYLATRSETSLGYLYDLKKVRPYSNGKDNSDALTLPLKVRDEAIGKLAVQGLSPDDNESVELANAVAERLGAHIESLRQYDRTQSALAQSERLFNASSLLTQATDLQELVAAAVTTLEIPVVNRALLTTFDFDAEGEVEQLNVIANWWSGEGQEVTPIGTRYPLEVVRAMPMFVSPTPVFFNDAFNDERVDETTMQLVKRLNLRAVAVLPLHLGSQQIGALILEAEEPHNFTPDETRLFESLAPQIATVLENRQQYERAQRQAEREAMLNTINQKIQSANSVEAVLQIAARELGHALGAPMTIAQLSMKDKN